MGIVVIVVMPHPGRTHNQGRTFSTPINRFSLVKALVRNPAGQLRLSTGANKMSVKIKVVQYPIEDERINKLMEVTGTTCMRDSVDAAVKKMLKEKDN